MLQRNIASAQQTYDTVTTRFNITNLESQATQTNVSILKNATPPLLPSGPRALLNTVAGLVLGALLGIAMALVRERIDPRLRSDEAIFQRMGQPLVGQLPVWTRPENPGLARSRLSKPLSQTNRSTAAS